MIALRRSVSGARRGLGSLAARTASTARTLLTLLGLALVLQACGSSGGQRPSTPAGTTAQGVPAKATPQKGGTSAGSDSRAGSDDVLDVEQTWLLSFFSGTPVSIQRTAVETLIVSVPAEFCFYANSSVIKPPLAKVLEKVAQSLRRRSSLRVQAMEAAPDAGQSGPAAVQLTRQRGLAVQKRLNRFGVPLQRLGSTGASSDGSAAVLRIQSTGL